MPVIPAKAGIQWIVAKYDLPGLIEKLHQSCEINYLKTISAISDQSWATVGTSK